MTKYTELIERHEGDGQLIKGDSPPLQVSYVLDIYQDFPDPGVPGLKRTMGFVSGLDERQLWDLQNQDLILVLEDGTRWIISIDNGTIIHGRPE